MPTVTQQLSAGGAVVVDDGFGLDAYVYVPTPGNALPTGIAPILVIAEPVDFAPGHRLLVQGVIGELVDGLAAGEPGADPSLLLSRLFIQANERLLAANQSSPERPLHLGLSCVVRSGRELAVVQAAPTQVIVRHEGVVEELPSLAGWTARDLPESAVLTPCGPLGVRRVFEPALSFVPAGPGTLVLGLASTLAASLAEQSGDLLLHSRPEEIAGRLARWLHTHDLHWGHAAVAHLDGQRRERPPRRRIAMTASHADPYGLLDSAARKGQTEETGVNVQKGAVDDGHNLTSSPNVATGMRAERQLEGEPAAHSLGPQYREDRVATRSSANADAPPLVIRARAEQFSSAGDRYAPGTRLVPLPSGAARLTAAPAAGRGLMEILAVLLVGLTAAVVSVWRISHTNNRPIHGPRDDGTLGLPHLQHWSEGRKARRFEGARRVAPRVEFSRIIVALVVLGVLTAGGFFIYTQLRGDETVDPGQVESQLAAIITLHAQANNAADPAGAYAILIEAQERANRLAGAFAEGEVDQRVIEQQQSIAAELSQLTKLTVLDAVQIVGGVPPAPEGVQARLFSGGGRVYLLSDALYQVDVTGKTLVRLLGAGDQVGDQAAGTLLAAAWREDGPYVVDGAAGYVYDHTRGAWSREPLGVIDGEGPPQVSAIAVFDYNLYVLEESSGRILKYAGGDYEAPPDDWNMGAASDDLQNATDMVVDGNIYVGLTDGRILHLFLSTLKATFTPQALPPVDAASGLAASPDVSAFYIMNESDGRILKLDAGGQLLQQYETGPELPSLEGITDLVVDEGTGIAYVLAGDALYATRLTPAE